MAGFCWKIFRFFSHRGHRQCEYYLVANIRTMYDQPKNHRQYKTTILLNEPKGPLTFTNYLVDLHFIAQRLYGQIVTSMVTLRWLSAYHWHKGEEVFEQVRKSLTQASTLTTLNLQFPPNNVNGWCDCTGTITKDVLISKSMGNDTMFMLQP